MSVADSECPAESVPELSADVVAWIATVAGGGEAQVTPFGHHRPLWSIDVVGGGRIVELFAKSARDTGSVLAPVYNLAREAAVIKALTDLGVPTPAFVGFHPDAQVLLLERIPGRGDFHNLDNLERRDRLASRFIEVLADLHRRRPEDFHLDATMAVPVTDDDHALAELRIAEPLYDAVNLSPEPIVAFGRGWLRRNVPQKVDHTCFVQGDTGPGNFVFDDDDVWLVDLEISHFGDPMEDLAAICVRDMVTPFGDLRRLFAEYESLVDWRLDLDRVRYHRVSKCVRSLMAIVSLAELGRQRGESLTWRAYRALYVRGACQALAEAMGLDLEGRRSGGALGAASERSERAELEGLLGSEVLSSSDGLRQLDGRLRSGTLACDEVDLLRFLSARADRQCLLMRPAMGAMADGRFSPID
jgi:aminoglycoside phosphotransferase (APT) family kinase protein